MIRWACDKCGYRIKAPEGWAGGKGKCPKCHHHVVVPLNGEQLLGDRAGMGADTRGYPASAVSGVNAGQRVRGDLAVGPCPCCGGAVLADAAMCVHCHQPLIGSAQVHPMAVGAGPDVEQLEREYLALQEFRSSYNRWSLLLGVPGFILVAISNVMALLPPAREDPMAAPMGNPLAVVLGLVGMVLLTSGLICYARYKGRNPLWGLVGLLTIIGLIVLCSIKDINRERMLVLTQMLQAARHPTGRVRPASRARTSGWAIASLVLGLCGLFTGGLTAILGFLLGICGLHDIRRSHGRVTGQGLAIAGICVSGFFLAIMLLAMIAGFLDGMSAGREARKRAVSAGVVRELCGAVSTYCRENRGALPQSDKWPQAMCRYYEGDHPVAAALGNADKRPFAMNGGLSGKRIGDVKDPGRTVLFFEAHPGGPSAGGGELLPAQPRDPRGYLVGFLSGSVTHVPAGEIDGLIWDPFLRTVARRK